MTGLVQALAATEVQSNNLKQAQLAKNGPVAKAASGHNQSCGICRAMKNFGQCKGHGSKAGGSGSGAEKEEQYQPSKNITFDPAKKARAEQLKNWIKNFMLVGEAEHLSHANALEYESDLFTIHSDRLKGTLLLHIKSNLSASDQKDVEDYIKAIKAGFHEFKDQLEKLGFNVSQFNVEETKDCLTLTIPAKHFGDFLQHLGMLNLLPAMKPSQKAEKDLEEDEQRQAKIGASSRH